MSNCEVGRCKLAAVAVCTHEWSAKVCERHLLPAACNDFRPIRYGQRVALWPHEAAQQVIAIREALSNRDPDS